MSLKDQILNAEDAKVVEVRVPEWGFSVHVRRISGLERGKLERQAQELRKANKYWERFKSLCACAALCETGGEPIDFTMQEFEQLAGKSAAAIERIFDASNELNRWVATDDMVKNSESSPSDSSGTG